MALHSINLFISFNHHFQPLHTSVVYLSSKFGQRYECQLPDVADVGKVQDEEKTAAETGISYLLKPMELAPCLLKVFSQVAHDLKKYN